MHWKSKAFLFRCFEVIPFGNVLHYATQKYITKRLPRPDHELAEVTNWARTMSKYLETFTGWSIEDARVVEFGAGRDLVCPLALSAVGVREVVALDRSRLAKIELISDAARRLNGMFSFELAEISSFDELLLRSRIDYMAPADVRSMDFASEDVTCVTSLSTLEHIAREDILVILGEIRRVVSSNGVCIMRVDYHDHYTRGDDDNISAFNFLKYSDRKWHWYNSEFQYVNRLRHSDFMNIFEECDFDILHSEAIRSEPDEQILRHLADRFRAYKPEDLFTKNGIFVVRPRKSQK